MAQIEHAHAPARDLVLVRGTDAAPRGADLALAAQPFAGEIDGFVIGHDHVRLFADAQLFVVDEMPSRLERLNFLDENLRIDDHAIADHAKFVRVQGARGHQVQDGFITVDDEGVAGVIATLKAHDDIGFIGKEIDNFSFTFITPLGADDCDVGHPD